jgi:hypothetical protein
MLGGNDDPICALRTRVRVVRVSRVSGRAPSAVFSRCSDVRAVNAPKEVGNKPATKVALSAPPFSKEIARGHTRRVSIADNLEGLEPCEICNLFRKRRREGREGQLSARSSVTSENSGDDETYNDETRPAPLHRTPFHAQNLTSLTQPPASSAARPCWSASSHIDLNPQNCIASRATAYAAVAFGGTAARSGRHVLHVYPVGFTGAFRLYCVMHCWVSAGSMVVCIELGGGLAGAVVVEGIWGIQRDRAYSRTSRTTTLTNR